MIDLQQFKMDPAEEALLAKLLAETAPRTIAEFGSGLTTRFWAQQSDAKIVTWDNFPEWIAELKTAFAGAPWLERVEFRGYSVSPGGPRIVQKDAVPWDGAPFDFLFLDGPRSAHPPSFGRSGSFLFATQHARPGSTIVWHDNERGHERALAMRFFGHLRCRSRGTVGWCIWQPPSAAAPLIRAVNYLAQPSRILARE